MFFSILESFLGHWGTRLLYLYIEYQLLINSFVIVSATVVYFYRLRSGKRSKKTRFHNNLVNKEENS